MSKVSDNFDLPDLSAKETWKELAIKSLKGQDIEKVLNSSTVEGVDFKGLYDSNPETLELMSFPKTFLLSTIYDSGLANAEDIEEDQAEGIESSFLVVRGKSWKKDFPKGIRLSFLIQKTSEEQLEEFRGKTAFVDSNKLNFEKFDEEVARVQEKGLGFAINMSQIHNAGASIVQEISFGLNIFSKLLQLGVEEQKILFVSAADSLFFMNIAKFRTLRFLAEEILIAHGKEPNPYILAASSLREQTLYDPWVNMLRNCASSMAAVLGGANEVSIRPHDAAFSALTGEPSESKARRSARHILNIVKEESKMDFVMDAGKGSFAIEELTSSLVKQAWESFLNWEDKNLLLNVKDFAASVEAISKARYEKARKRKSVITGINDFANSEESLESLYKKPWRPVTLTTGLFPLRRSALEFEELRVATEKSGIKIKVALIYKGRQSSLSARINFAKNVFEVLGVEVAEYPVEERLEQAYELAQKEGCNALALVGKDDEYAQWIKAGDKEVFKSQFIAGNKERFTYGEGGEVQFDSFTDIYAGKNIYHDLREMLLSEGVEL